MGRTSEALAEALAADTDECIVWAGDMNSHGYPRVAFGRSQLQGHVIACVAQNGPAPPGTEASHTCGARRCVNPRHLVWETHAVNIGRTVTHGTSTRGERHGQAKLTNEQAATLRRRYAEGGVLHRELAAEYGLSRSAVTRIISGKHAY